MRLTPDLTRNATPEEMDESLRYAIAYRDRGIVGVGLGAFELEYPPHLYEDVFRRARDGGLGSVPHAGELGPPDAIRDAIHLLQADRLRHGIRAIEDPDLVQELKERGTVLDVCPVSNVRVGVVPSLAEHPLPQLVAAGVLCSLSTDDPPMFDTDLTTEYAAACSLGLEPRGFYEAGVAGALCDEATKARLGRHRRGVRLGRSSRAGGARLAPSAPPRPASRPRARRGHRRLRGLSSTAVNPVRPHSPSALIMWKTTPVWRDWSK